MGTCDLTLQLGNVTHTAMIAVLESIHTPLLSWHDCVRLGILPTDFPRQIRRVEQRSSPVRLTAPATAGAATTGAGRRDAAAGAATGAAVGAAAGADAGAGRRGTATATAGSAARSAAGDGGRGDAAKTGVGVTAAGAGRRITTSVHRESRRTTSADARSRSVPAETRAKSTDRHAAGKRDTTCIPDGRNNPPEWIMSLKPNSTPPFQRRQEHFKALKAEFPRVFDVKSGLRVTAGEPMSIELTDDAVPYAQTCARNIPYNWRDDVRRQLDELQEHDIIEPVEHPTEWCHPLCPVSKTDSDGKSVGCRITVDFTKLNRFVKRPVHPARTPQDAVSSITTGAKLFTKNDCKAINWP